LVREKNAVTLIFIMKYPLLFSLLVLPGVAQAIPSAPLGLAMDANSPSSVTLTWYRPPAEEAVASYHVYFSDTKEGAYKRFATVSERKAVHEKLTPGAEYFYKVSATDASGESVLSAPAKGFSIASWTPAPFPVKIAKNMCVSLGSTIVSTPAPTLGKLADLVDGSDATSCGINAACEVKIKLDPKISIGDAKYLLLNFRSDMTGQGYSYKINWRSLKDYVIIESHDSTDGNDGTWSEVVKGTNIYLDGVVVIPNNKPKWIGVRNSGSLQLCRLEVFRSAPAGFRNDYWIFAGDSLIVQDLMGGSPERHTVWFSDLIRQRHPDRHPIVVNSSQGGEMLENTIRRLKNGLLAYSLPNGSDIPTATMVCVETGFNDVGVGGGLWMGPKIIARLNEARELCESLGLILVPVRIQYSTAYLNPDTLEPKKYNVFHNTLAVNLAGVDVFARTHAPYAVDPQTQVPYADYWTYTRKHYATALSKDGVHHTKAGSDGINLLWADVAEKMIYSRQP
jgi:hypothetical protein